MISYRDIEKLLGMGAPEPSVLSLYLSVPLDTDGLRGLPARADELFTLATEGAGAPQVSEQARREVRAMLGQHARDWLGHSVAIFLSRQAGLSQAYRLPCPVPERAVVAARPHVRPLLVALQRCPAYRVAVIDSRHAWLLRVEGERIATVSRSTTAGVRSPGFGGWYGLESHRINERIIQLTRHHYRDTAALLERPAGSGEREPLVIGGHEQTIGPFLATLPAPVRARVAGSFIADPHTLTPARVRTLAEPVIVGWVEEREQDLVRQFLTEPPSPLTVTGLPACLAAASQHAVGLLLVPVGTIVPGYLCGRCGALSATPAGCPDEGNAAIAVPDLIEEMAVATIADGGEVMAVREPPGEVAARLRFPLTPGTQA